MKIKIWGARGSIPAPGPETMRYGGNTSCVELTLSDGSTLILDAGTGLMFFAPAFRRQCEITVWGPRSHDDASLCDRVARYISAPLAPLDLRELPLNFCEATPGEWKLGSATIRAQPVNHRGPTLGYRIEDGDISLCYIPDH